MKKGTDIARPERALIIIGDPGTRKTTLALHFPKPYFFDCDGNLSAPVEYTGITNFSYDVSVRTDDDLPVHQMFRYLHCIQCLNKAVLDPDIDTIIIDSLTTFSDILICEVKRQEHAKAFTPVPFTKELTTAQLTGLDNANNQAMRIQDWGKFLFLLKDFITKMRTCGKTFVIISHNNYEKDEVDGRYKQFINVPGQSKTTMSGLFTDCWHVFLQVSGIGDAVKHDFRVRTLPVNDVDHRGIKSSFKALKRLNTFEEAIAVLKSLKEPAPLTGVIKAP